MSLDYYLFFTSDQPAKNTLRMLLDQRGEYGEVEQTISRFTGEPVPGIFCAAEELITYWCGAASPAEYTMPRECRITFNQYISMRFRFSDDLPSPSESFFHTLVAMLPQFKGDLGWFFQLELAIFVRRNGIVYLNIHPDGWLPETGPPMLPFPHERISLDFDDPFPPPPDQPKTR